MKKWARGTPRAISLLVCSDFCLPKSDQKEQQLYDGLKNTSCPCVTDELARAC